MAGTREVGGVLAAGGRHFAIVAARFNDLVVERLVGGAVDTLVRHGADEGAIEVIRCPGSFELPHVTRRAAASGRYDAVIAIGCLIRGDTPHFDHLCAFATRGIGDAGLQTDVPVAFGLLTCDTLEQALERAGAKMGNKGAEAALAAIEMADLLPRLSGP
jgi:6,7-dimethyl-8-ribityllumazine synthase